MEVFAFERFQLGAVSANAAVFFIDLQEAMADAVEQNLVNSLYRKLERVDQQGQFAIQGRVEQRRIVRVDRYLQPAATSRFSGCSSNDG